MASESEISATEMQLFLERLITSRNRDISMSLPFMLGFSGPDLTQTRPNSEENPRTPEERRERIVLINPMTQGMVVIEGAGLDSLFHGVQSKEGQPPASKSAIEKMASVEIREGEEKECVICLEECKGLGILRRRCHVSIGFMAGVSING
ncbi:uncharacterized protein LOC110712669 [Chenopodium quinoa]|uniref:uncharacterized protein LOC110712669 n=1 Tax=Chenopodium quinoa TaxID=63459 RepID=UPI000B78E1A3|nr:uncharacterized protein LOC110712669 [Chenopodium quinoa]